MGKTVLRCSAVPRRLNQRICFRLHKQQSYQRYHATSHLSFIRTNFSLIVASNCKWKTCSVSKGRTYAVVSDISFPGLLNVRWQLFSFPQIPSRVRTTTSLLDGFTTSPQSGCLLWSSYLSLPTVWCWWPLPSSRNCAILWTGSWSILPLLILERQFLPALLVCAIRFLATSFWDIQCASLRVMLSPSVVSTLHVWSETPHVCWVMSIPCPHTQVLLPSGRWPSSPGRGGWWCVSLLEMSSLMPSGPLLESYSPGYGQQSGVPLQSSDGAGSLMHIWFFFT